MEEQQQAQQQQELQQAAGEQAARANKRQRTAAPDASAAGQPAVGLGAALDGVDASVGGLTSALAQLREAAASEREALAREWQRLGEEREALALERSRIAQAFADNDRVVLNVGGTHFTTTVATLRDGAPPPSLFAAMFSGRYPLPVAASDGAVFIDRDGSRFAGVLNWLRTQALTHPAAGDGADYRHLLELRCEAEYFGLEGLIREIDRHRWGVTRAVRGVAVAGNGRWAYEEGRDELVFSVDKPVQLMGAGLCISAQGYTAQLEVYKADPEALENNLELLASCTQTFPGREVPADAKADSGAYDMYLPGGPVSCVPGELYKLSASIEGEDSLYAENCAASVAVEGGVRVTLKVYESPNCTSEERGQIPQLLLRVLPGQH